MTQILPQDLLSNPEFLRHRHQLQNDILVLKKARRLQVGPFAMFLFENRKTLLWQIQEMLRIEKGGDAQIAEEIEAYAPMVPQPYEMVATLLIEIADEALRKHTLMQLGHIDQKITLEGGEVRLHARPTDDHPRTTEEGKTSAVHFIKFVFTPETAKNFEDASLPFRIKIDHPQYAYQQEISHEVRQALIEDLTSTYEKAFS